MLFAVVMVKLLLPFFNDVTDKSIQLNLSDPVFVVGILSITIVAGYWQEVTRLLFCQDSILLKY
jgi:hypothetical protein